MLSSRRYAARCIGMSFFIVLSSLWALEVDLLSKEWGMSWRNSGIGSSERISVDSAILHDNQGERTECASSPTWMCDQPQDRQYGTLFASGSLKRPTCALALIIAGTPRSGSTLIQAIAKTTLNLLAVHSHITYADIGYWRFHRHIRKPPNSDLSTMRKVLGRVKNRTQVVLVKTHEYDPELLELCNQSLVVTSTREITDMMRSWVGAGWLRRNCTDLTVMLSKVTKNQRCWQRHAGVRFIYSDIESDKRFALIIMMSAVMSKLSIRASQSLPFERLFKDEVFSSGFMDDEANPGIPSSRNGSFYITCETSRLLQHEFSQKSY